MTERRLNNTIFLMYLCLDIYCKAHDITARQFLELCKEHDIIHYVAECPDYYDSLPDFEKLEDMNEYFSE
ncbi:MAG: hypothetical protein LUD47_03340 [Clostridia bacterium]|nr:hypothetical protein [Clostridia bacterium]